MSSTEAEIANAAASEVGQKTTEANQSATEIPGNEIDIADIPMPMEPQSAATKPIGEEPDLGTGLKPTTNGESTGEDGAEVKDGGGLKIAEEERQVEEEKEKGEHENEQSKEMVEDVIEKRMVPIDTGDGNKKQEEKKEEHDEETEKDGEWEVIEEKEVDQAREEVRIAEDDAAAATAATEKASEEMSAKEKPMEEQKEHIGPVIVSVPIPRDEKEESKEERNVMTEGEQAEIHEEKMEIDEPAQEIEPRGEEEHTEEKKVEKEGEQREEDMEGTPPEEMKAPEKKEEEIGTKRVLPKWMVEDANAPPSPQPEESTEKTEGGEAAGDATPTSTPGRGRGRGRGGRGRGSTRSTLAKPPQLAEGEQQAESLSAGRPRRSTRSTVDYAHPDVATVVAEQEDLENELQQKVTRSRGKGRGRGRGRGTARKVAGTDEDEDAEDSGSEYGASSKKKKGSTPGRGRGRGRGRGAKARRTRSAKKKAKKDESEEEEEEEMQLEEDDDAASPGSGEEAYKPTPSKRRSEPTQWKQPPKKRGRHAVNAEKEHDQ